MTALTREPVCPVTRKLVALLDDKHERCPAARSLNFADRLDSLEVEAIETDVAPTTLVLIRVAREATEFAEKIASRSRRV